MREHNKLSKVILKTSEYRAWKNKSKSLYKQQDFSKQGIVVLVN